MKIHIEVFRVMTPCSDMVEYHRFGGPEDGGTMALRNVGILLHHYMMS